MAAGAVAASAVLVTGVFAFANSGSAPQRASAEVYQDLLEHRAVRADVRLEPQPPSILDGAVVGDTADAEAAAADDATDRWFGAAISRLRIDSINVNAQVVSLNLTAEGNMDVPRGGEPVGWYDFTAKPGLPGNAVISGHVSWAGGGPAVFQDLAELDIDDLIEVELADGTVVQYAVTAFQSYAVDTINMNEIIAPTSVQSMTLITCGGEYSAGSYSDRHIIRAVRVGYESPSEQPST